jgi:acyl-homoserine-lactone acylase
MGNQNIVYKFTTTIRMKQILLFFIFPFSLFAQPVAKSTIARWEKQAQQITIMRDNWGIPHIYGKTDADAVFGLMYAQCEDDFKRIEMNFIEKLGRLAEIKGESALYDDLLIRMIIDSTEAIADYKKAPSWLKKLLTAQADAYNFYLYKHPEIKPALLTRFQPWYNLLWTDGSIGAINTADITTTDLKNLYGEAKDKTGDVSPKQYKEEILTGSNGFAFSPKITEGGKAILYINPHVTFYFRPEVHVVSEEGLNAYGAVTWGQFFVYQGFNEHCGWMHTSNYTDIADTYIEKLNQRNNKWYYVSEKVSLPVRTKKITLRYQNQGKILAKTIDALYTGHGPIMAKRDGQYLSMKANNRSMGGLIQSWQRTKAKSFAEYKKVMDLLENTSNNTVYADKEGNIAYWHGNFLPKRDVKFDWTKPVDGSINATQWRGLHPVEESVHIYNPANGWIQNCNSTPFTAAGENSPKKENYPKYMAPDGENFRGINAVKVLAKETKYTLDKVIAAGYDTNLAAFEVLIPALVQAFEKNETQYPSLKEPMSLLKSWDFHSGTQSIPTTLAIEWGTRLLPKIQTVKGILLDEEADQVTKTKLYVTTCSPEELLNPFVETLKELEAKFGTWQVTWGDINRFQRISSDMSQKYDDAQPSIPVPFASSTWGMLPSYNGRYFEGTKKRYGVNGNSFICAVEFGDKIKAKSLLAGGQSGDPKSQHFKDQMEMYTKGQFKDVLFYKEDILKHVEKTYHPGE